MRLSLLLASAAVAFITLPALAQESGRDHWRTMTPDQREQWKTNHPEAVSKFEAGKEKWQDASPEHAHAPRPERDYGGKGEPGDGQ